MFKFPPSFDGLRADTNVLLNQLKPRPLEDGFPVFLMSSIINAIKENRLPDPGIPFPDGWHAFHYVLRYTGIRWVSHWGRLKYENGREALVSEPYAEAIDRNVLHDLLRFCDVLKLDFQFDANSEHHPGRTLRILIGPLH